ncbi:mariner transposase [Trichonephila clavipes]|nr:mariner transposase [Trichonephila clavipes]
MRLLHETLLQKDLCYLDDRPVTDKERACVNAWKNYQRRVLSELIAAFKRRNQAKDNAPTHKSVISMAKINELKFELLPHEPYSPDLAPSDYFLFPNLKTWLSGQRFSNDEEVILVVNGYFEEQDSSYNKKSIKLFEHHWEKCT